MRLIHNFLADGDPGAIGEDIKESLRQHRNSIIVENIPPWYRTDEDITDFYDKLFPGNVRRAELVIDSRKLKQLIQKRQLYLEKYESLYAKLRHEWHCYDKKRGDHASSAICFSTARTLLCPTRTPTEPFLYIAAENRRICQRRKVKVKALPYYLHKIDELNDMIESEHTLILEKRGEIRGAGTHSVSSMESHNGLNSGNGFVEFRSRTIKSSGKTMLLYLCFNISKILIFIHFP